VRGDFGPLQEKNAVAISKAPIANEKAFITRLNW